MASCLLSKDLCDMDVAISFILFSSRRLMCLTILRLSVLRYAM